VAHCAVSRTTVRPPTKIVLGDLDVGAKIAGFHSRDVGVYAVPIGAEKHVVVLLSRCLTVLRHNVRRYPAAVFHLDTLLPGPLTDLVRVDSAGTAAAAGDPASAANRARFRDADIAEKRASPLRPDRGSEALDSSSHGL
jgi:hypothetical protein